MVRRKERRRSLSELLLDPKLMPPPPREKRYQSRPPISQTPTPTTTTTTTTSNTTTSTTTRLPTLKNLLRSSAQKPEPSVFPKKKNALNRSTMKKKVFFDEAPEPPTNQCAPPMDKARLYQLEKQLGNLEKKISRAK